MKSKIKESGLFMFVMLLLSALLGIAGGGVMTAEAGAVTMGEPVSLEYALENSPEVVKAVIDREVVVIKPHLTPLYTLGSKRARTVTNAKSMIIQYDEIESLPLVTKVNTAFSTSGQTQAAVDFADNDVVSINQTLVFKGINGYLTDGTTTDGWFVGYVKDKDSSGKPIIVAVNGATVGGTANCIPALAKDTIVLRGLRTGSEKQVRTAPLAAVPTKKEQYMQKALIETEETTWFELSQSLADVKWGKSEITDFAIFEHKQSAETDILLGKKSQKLIANKYNWNKPELTFFQEGLWWQAGKDFELPKAATRADLITMMKKIFVGNASSNTKIAFLGSDVLETINKVDYNQVIYPGKQGQVFGLDVQRIIYGQYTLLLCAEPAFDDLKMEKNGLVIDDAYLHKYGRGWEMLNLDNKQLGTSDSKSQILIEHFCFVLKNAKAHTRITLGA